MEETKKEKKRYFIWRVAILLVAVLVVYNFASVLMFFSSVLKLIFPFLVGLGIAYIWSLLMTPIEKNFFPNSQKPIMKKLRRPAGVVLSLLIILGVIAFTLYLVIPQIYQSLIVMTDALPAFANEVKQWFLSQTAGVTWAQEIRNRVQGIDVDWQVLFQNIMARFEGGLSGILGSTVDVVRSVVDFIVAGFTAIVFTIYILVGKEKIGDRLNRVAHAYLPDKLISRGHYMLKELNETFANFFRGQVLDAFIIGVLLFIALSIFRFPYALTISVVVMVTALIPMIGAFIGGGVGFLMIAVVDMRQAFLFLIVLVAIQQLEGDLIYPKIVGDAIGLPGVWVFAAVIVGGSIAGPVGMIIAVPLLATIYKLLRNDVNNRLGGVQNRQDDTLDITEEDIQAQLDEGM